jgi:pimeloyl-ACP methyl ester carboxylesterase
MTAGKIEVEHLAISIFVRVTILDITAISKYARFETKSKRVQLLVTIRMLTRGLPRSRTIPKEPTVTSISLVLLPGLDGTGLLFKPLIAALPPTITPIIVPYPGDRHLTYQQLLPLALKALPQSNPFILLGESFSGPLAAMIAAGHPKNLAGLILSASFVTPPWRFVGPAIPIFARGPIFNLYMPYKRIRARLGGYSTPQRRALIEQMHKLVPPHVFASRVRMVFRVDARDALRSCNVPMLYLKAAHDMVVPGRNLRVIQQIKPSVQVVTIGSSHMLLQRHPIESAQAISTFASSLGAGTHEI